LKNIQANIQQSKFTEAINECKTRLEQELSDVDRVELLYLLAVAYRYDDKIDQALETTEIIIKINPNHGRARQERGYNYLAKDQKGHAQIAFNEAVRINPALMASWQQLEKLYQQGSQNTELQIVRSKLNHLQRLPAQLLSVTELLYERKLLKAENLCRHYLQNNKHNIDAMRLLAEIGIELKIYDDAEFLLESCAELAPNDVLARTQYLNLLIRLGKYSKARIQADYLHKIRPHDMQYKISQASILIGLGETEEGVKLYREVLKVNSKLPGVHLQLGHALKAKGDIEKAIIAYQSAYKLKPEFGDAYWSLANTKTYQFTDKEISAIQQLLKNAKLGKDDQAYLNFAVGKACEDRKQYSDAFKYYQQGNDVMKKRSGYYPEYTQQQVEQQIKFCTTELFQERGKLGLELPDPIFIVGLPRAGSTLLEQILASHSQIDGTMELHNILGLSMRLRGRAAKATPGEDSKYPQNLAEIDPSYFKRFGEQFINETRVYREKAPFFIDKMPNNFMHIGLIRLILPNAKIIDARREPMACCFSGFKQLFGEGQDFTYGLEDVGRYYNSYLKMMAHWDKVLPGFILRVQHEDVIADLETQVRRMLDFCGLEFEQSCLEFYKTQRNIKTPSSEQVRQPIYKTSVEQWKNFESHLEPLKAILFSESN